MKIRKALAVVLSLAMTVTLMPATAFATTKNTASTPVTVADGDEIPESYIEMEISNSAPVDMTYTDAEHDKSMTLTFDLDNAKWAENPTIAAATPNAAATWTIAHGPVFTISGNDDGNENTNTDNNFNRVAVTRVDDSSITVEFSTAVALSKEATITATFPNGVLLADGDEGEEIQVEIDPGDNRISATTLTIATIAGGGTSATVTGSVKAYATRTKGVTGAEVTIKETTSTAIADGSVHVLKMQLPKEVEWTATPLTITGSLFEIPDGFATAGVTSATALLDKAIDEYGDTEVYNADNKALYYLANDDRTLYVALVANGTDARQSAYIKANFNITKDASEGDVTLSISDAAKNPANTGEFSSASGLVIAKVGTDGVTVSTVAEDELPTIVSGQITDTDNEFFWVEVKLAESVAESLTLGKDIDFEFSDGVQVVTPHHDDANCDGVKISLDKAHDLDDVSKATKPTEGEFASDRKFYVEYGNSATAGKHFDDTSEVTLTVPAGFDNNNKETGKYGNKTFNYTKANTVVVFFPVTVRADVTGDVKVKVSGKDFDDTTLTVAKAVAPITVEATATNVVNGAKNQALADITVKENVAGYVGKNNGEDKIYFELNTGGIGNGYAFDNASVKVTSGDLELKNTVHYNGELMWVEVDDASTEASTFVISGVVINLSRTLAEGPYDLEVTAKGEDNALAENQLYNKGKFGDDDTSVNVAATPYVNITTAADTAQTGTVANFYLDGSKNSTYTVNGVDNTMDAAAYLDSNNRTMVPIRYVAYALGLKDTDISYSTGDSTATLSGLTNVVKVTTGSNVLQASNGNVTMDTVAVNNGGRLYVPARFIAQAMGAQVAWDQATKTVTITK